MVLIANLGILLILLTYVSMSILVPTFTGKGEREHNDLAVVRGEFP